MVKIERDAFLYMERTGSDYPFAQCVSCALYDGKARRCRILGDKNVPPEASCGMYVPGPGAGKNVPNETLQGGPQPFVRPEEVGYVNASVRCENCRSFDGDSGCKLFAAINKAIPEIFQLEAAVSAHGCCNAWMPKGSTKAASFVDAVLAGRKGR